MLDSCITNYFEHDKNLLMWLTYTGEDGQVWYIVSDLYRNEYQLWKDNKKTKYTSDNPEDLYEHIKDKGVNCIMKYMGSKSRIAKYIVPIIQQCIDDNSIEYYIEPFVGGANVIDKIICKNKSGSDKNEYLIALLDHVARGGKLLLRVPRELYNDVRTAYNSNQDTFSKVVTANVGFLASYNGRWFDGGYAQSGFEKTKHGERYRDYYQESKRNLETQAKNLVGINFSCHDYRELPMTTTSNNVIYCDPPYANTKQFANSQNFNYDEFWETMRQWSKNNYVIISELEAPDDFICIWQKDVQRSMKSTDNTMRAVEKLFVYKNGLYAQRYCKG